MDAPLILYIPFYFGMAYLLILTGYLFGSRRRKTASPKCCECGKKFRIAEWGFITKNGLHHANCDDHDSSAGRLL